MTLPKVDLSTEASAKAEELAREIQCAACEPTNPNLRKTSKLGNTRNRPRKGLFN